MLVAAAPTRTPPVRAMFGTRPNMKKEGYTKWWYTSYGGYKLVGLTWKDNMVMEQWERLPAEAWQGAPDDMPMDRDLDRVPPPEEDPPKTKGHEKEPMKKPSAKKKAKDNKAEGKDKEKPGNKPSSIKTKGKGK